MRSTSIATSIGRLPSVRLGDIRRDIITVEREADVLLNELVATVEEK